MDLPEIMDYVNVEILYSGIGNRREVSVDTTQPELKELARRWCGVEMTIMDFAIPVPPEFDRGQAEHGMDYTQDGKAKAGRNRQSTHVYRERIFPSSCERIPGLVPGVRQAIATFD
jgi:hypothetical protein